MTNGTPSTRVEREARLRWVPIPQMRVSPLAQRDLNQPRVDHIAADLNIEDLGTPTVNERDGHFYIIDGQHRIRALEQMGWGDQQIQCWTYVGLTEEEEAERFLRLNDNLAVDALYKYRVGVVAGRDEETDIERIVRSQGLVVSRDGIPGAIAAVGTLRRIYKRADGKTLARALALARDAYGDAGMAASVIDGLGLVCQRYNGQLNDAEAVAKLGAVHGGANGLLGKAEILRRQTGSQKGHCVAAAAVEVINAGKGSKKLQSWWKTA